MKYLIYNFGGAPGDLYQLVPDKFLATLCSVLNREEPASAVVCDRSNLIDATQLLPDGILRWSLTKTGERLFEHLRKRGKASFVDKAVFGTLNVMAGRKSEAVCRRIIEQDADWILSEEPEVVFTNLRHGPGFLDTIRLVNILRRRSPNIRLFGIGHRASWFARELAEMYPDFDAFVVGPSSYESMAALARGADPADLPNVTFSREGDIHSTPRLFCEGLAADVIPDCSPENYRGIESQLLLREVVLANEACPFSCHFCIRPPTYGTKWEARDVNSVVDEVEHYFRQKGIRCFRFSDSTPPPNMLTAVAKELIDRGLDREDLHISSFGRLNRNMREDYDLLRQAGFEAMFFGVESGSQKMLDDVLGKKITVGEIKESVRLAHEAGISVVTSFIFPLPGETLQSRQETLDLLAELKPYIASALIQPAGVYPGTPWHTQAERFGILIHDDYVRQAVTYPIEPLKPLRFWRPFPFSYDLMGKPAKDVGFQDIVECFEEFTRKVWGREVVGGLDIPNVQDYGFVLARSLNQDPAEFSRESLMYMVTHNLKALSLLCGIRQAA